LTHVRGYVGQLTTLIFILYLFIKHIHIDGREQDSGTGQQGTHSTLTVGLYTKRAESTTFGETYYSAVGYRTFSALRVESF